MASHNSEKRILSESELLRNFQLINIFSVDEIDSALQRLDSQKADTELACKEKELALERIVKKAKVLENRLNSLSRDACNEYTRLSKEEKNPSASVSEDLEELSQSPTDLFHELAQELRPGLKGAKETSEQDSGDTNPSTSSTWRTKFLNVANYGFRLLKVGGKNGEKMRKEFRHGLEVMASEGLHDLRGGLSTILESMKWASPDFKKAAKEQQHVSTHQVADLAASLDTLITLNLLTNAYQCHHVEQKAQSSPGQSSEEKSKAGTEATGDMKGAALDMKQDTKTEEKQTIRHGRKMETNILSIASDCLSSPLVRRFEFHFCGGRATGRADKPEWAIKWAVQTLEGHVSFLREKAEPVVRRVLRRSLKLCDIASKPASHDFPSSSSPPLIHFNSLITEGLPPSLTSCVARGLIKGLMHKLSEDLELVGAENPGIFRQIVNQSLNLEQKLNRILRKKETEYVCEEVWELLLHSTRDGTKEAAPAEKGKQESVSMTPRMAQWLQVEKEFANEELAIVRSSSRPWKLNAGKDLQESECLSSLIHLLEEFQKRFGRIPKLSHRLRFALDLERPLVKLFLQFSEDSLEDLCKTAEKAIVTDATKPPEKAIHAWEDLAGYATSLALLESRLQEWGEMGLYLELMGLERSSAKSQDSDRDDQDDATNLASGSFWESEEDSASALVQESVRRTAEVTMRCLSEDLRLWKDAGHQEGHTGLVQSHPTFFHALGCLSWRTKTLRLRLRNRPSLWESCFTHLRALVDKHLLKYLLHAQFTSSGLRRFQIEVEGIAASLSGDSTYSANSATSNTDKKHIEHQNFPRVYGSLSLLKRPRQEVVKVRSQLHDSSLSADQSRLVLKAWGIMSLGTSDVLRLIEKKLDQGLDQVKEVDE